jgi:hypothetical protein
MGSGDISERRIFLQYVEALSFRKITKLISYHFLCLLYTKLRQTAYRLPPPVARRATKRSHHLSTSAIFAPLDLAVTVASMVSASSPLRWFDDVRAGDH